MFSLRTKKNNFPLRSLIWGPAYVVDAQKSHLNVTVLLNTHNMFQFRNAKNNLQYIGPVKQIYLA